MQAVQSSTAPRTNSPRGLALLATPSFRTDIEHQAHRWDDEWLSYMVTERAYAHEYFINRRNESTPDAASLAQSIAELTPRAFFDFKPLGRCQFGIWIHGAWATGARVAELGCGPGMLGKSLAPYCADYLGIDYSKLALQIARLTSPGNCAYLHLGDIAELEQHRGTRDLCVGRYFFIHQNWRNAQWVLGLHRDLLRSGGRVSADFYARRLDVPAPKHRSWRFWQREEVVEEVHANAWLIRSPDDELIEEHPSCMFEYTDQHIERLAAECGFEVEAVDYVPDLQRRFAIFRKP